MNKKLFSWKALAGLALLVAMGLTSCKQGAEVDPNDPYNTNKPATPGSSTKGSADVTITVLAASDLVDQYNKWVSTLTTDQKKAIADASEFTIGINGASYKLDGNKLTLPKVWTAGATGKTLNVVFTSGFAELKNALMIDADANNNGANVNITLPGQEFALDLTAASVRSSIKSEGEATISKLTGTTSTNDKNALKVGTGVTVKALNLTSGLVAKDGGAVEAIVLTADPTWDKENIKSNGLTFENLIIAGTVNLSGDKDKTKLNNIAINDGGALTLTTVNSIASIEGLADFSKGQSSKLTVNDQLGKVAAIKNVEIQDASLKIAKDVFTSAIFANGITLTADALSSVKVKGNIAVDIAANNKTISFAGVDALTINVTGAVETQTDITKTSYKWDNTKWVKQNAVIEGATEYTYKAGKFYIDSAGQLVDSDDAQAVPADKYEITIVEYSTASIKPKNAVIALDGDCKVNGTKVSGKNITALFGGAQANKPFFTVTQGSVTYAWEENSANNWVLIAQ